jgi:hypothetical protein
LQEATPLGIDSSFDAKAEFVGHAKFGLGRLVATHLLALFLGFLLATAVLPQAALGLGVTDYVKNYHLGINLIGTNDQVSVSYDIPEDAPEAPNCQKDASGHSTCWSGLFDHGRGLGAEYLRGFGLFLQQPFKRQGFWYFSADFSLGFLHLAGASPDKPDAGPFRSMSYSLYGFRFKPFIQFGITPAFLLPDVLISAGPVAHALMGQVVVNGEGRNSALFQRTRLFTGINPFAYAFLELEVVFWRFGDGAFSFYTARSRTDDRRASGSFYPGEKDGMTNFQATFHSDESGLKLLLNWP